VLFEEVPDPGVAAQAKLCHNIIDGQRVFSLDVSIVYELHDPPLLHALSK